MNTPATRSHRLLQLFRQTTFLALVIQAAASAVVVQGAEVPKNDIFPRPAIVPVPTSVANVAQPAIVVNGAWKTSNSLPAEYWNNATDLSTWGDLQVGGRGGRGGPGGGRGGSAVTAYKKQLTLPADFAGKRVVLRFDGVSNAAKVWVNGTFVRDHWGTDQAWSCDITDFIKPGEDAWLTVGVDNSRTGLAQFVQAGGLQRDVKLLAEPQNYLTRFHVETDMDKDYRDATMKVWLRMDFHQGDAGSVKITLKDAQGNPVKLLNDIVQLTRANPEVIAEIPVANPLKWDAEHPNLYTLEATVLQNDQPQETLSKQMGFIKLEMDGKRQLVNGKEVKFRGVWGLSDPKTMVAFNINHTRQKWVTEAFLDECDRQGVYVLDENPVDFAKNGVPNDPQFGYQYLNFIADLIERDRDHPCIVMWGLCNESEYGSNILPTFQYASVEDPHRLTMFSWPSQVPQKDELPYSAYSYHYPTFDSQFTLYANAPQNTASVVADRKPQPNIPVIADEYAHLPIYDPQELARDPNVHDFWGNTVKVFWERMYTTPGVLGGDIFGFNQGQFGSKNPEAFEVKKAYSPIRVDGQALANPGSGRPISIAIKNWFNHTNLNEIKIVWSVGADSGTLMGPDIAPRAVGKFQLPARPWQDGDAIKLAFYRQDGLLIDEALLPVAPHFPALPTAAGPAPQVQDGPEAITVSGPDFQIAFSKQTGLVTQGAYQGTNLIQGGPALQLTGVKLEPWALSKISARREDKEAVVSIEGAYGALQVGFEVRVDGHGLITTHYTLHNVPPEPPAFHAHPWDSTDYGGFSEVGVSYVLSNNVDQLAWHRRGLWSYYPEDQISRTAGVAARTGNGGNWATQAFSGGGRGGRGGRGGQAPGGAGAGGNTGTNDFRGMKENIYDASVLVSGEKKGLQALSDGSDAVRLEINGQSEGGVRLIVNNAWNYTQLGNGDYMKDPIYIPEGYSNTVRLRFVANNGVN